MLIIYNNGDKESKEMTKKKEFYFTTEIYFQENLNMGNQTDMAFINIIREINMKEK